MKDILVHIDGSPRSMARLDLAIDLASRRVSRAFGPLIHVKADAGGRRHG